MTQVMGRPVEEMRGLPLWEIEPRWPFDEYDRLQRQLLRTGETVFTRSTAGLPVRSGSIPGRCSCRRRRTGRARFRGCPRLSSTPRSSTGPAAV
ncbi:hypothetical protein [Streptomyces sp. V4I8]|uniref:hypothetical protein n=1 Tax=Streptomyces sp. V4I8 TaxID=3156469 RepID=UPI003512B3E0